MQNTVGANSGETCYSGVYTPHWNDSIVSCKRQNLNNQAYNNQGDMCNREEHSDIDEYRQLYFSNGYNRSGTNGWHYGYGMLFTRENQNCKKPMSFHKRKEDSSAAYCMADRESVSIEENSVWYSNNFLNQKWDVKIVPDVKIMPEDVKMAPEDVKILPQDVGVVPGIHTGTQDSSIPQTKNETSHVNTNPKITMLDPNMFTMLNLPGTTSVQADQSEYKKIMFSNGLSANQYVLPCTSFTHAEDKTEHVDMHVKMKGLSNPAIYSMSALPGSRKTNSSIDRKTADTDGVPVYTLPHSLLQTADTKVQEKTHLRTITVDQDSLSMSTSDMESKQNKNHLELTRRQDKPHMCMVCNKDFKVEGALNEHMRIHTPEGPFKCTVCNKAFRTKSSLNGHTGIHASERPYKCTICSKSFKQKRDLIVHLEIHSEERPYKCIVCNKRFQQRFYLTRHMKVHTGERPHKCAVCNKRFQQRSDMKIHMRLHTGEKSYMCTMCNKKFRRSCTLTMHMRLHTCTVEKSFECTHCFRTFKSSVSLALHKRTHVTKDFKCHTCGRPFKSDWALKRHQNIFHTEDKKPVECTECKKCFRYRRDLKMHMRVHSGERPYVCHICGKAFAHENNLRCHLKIHAGIRAHVCTICDKSFTQKNVLQRHLISHTGEKLFKCDVCDKSFTRGNNLKTHMREHTGNKPYKCTFCEKTFIYPSVMAVHMRLHTGDKPFKCSVCEEGFIHKGFLNKHMKSHG